MTAAQPGPQTVPYPRRRALRALLRAGAALGFAALADFRIEGRENLPKHGPLLLVGNHFSFLDPVAMIYITRYPLEFLGGTLNPGAPRWTKVFRDAWGILPVNRGGSSRDALLRAEHVLRQNGVLCIFPEGGNWATVLRPARPGAALLAARTGVPVVPVGFDGLLDVFPLRAGRRARVTVRIGPAFGPFGSGSRPTRADLEHTGSEMMRQIAALLPPERRGFFSDDPAVRAAALGTELYPWDGAPEI